MTGEQTGPNNFYLLDKFIFHSSVLLTMTRSGLTRRGTKESDSFEILPPTCSSAATRLFFPFHGKKHPFISVHLVRPSKPLSTKWGWETKAAKAYEAFTQNEGCTSNGKKPQVTQESFGGITVLQRAAVSSPELADCSA